MLILGGPAARAAVELAVTASPDLARPGDHITVRVTISNNGAASEGNLTVAMDYPDEMDAIFESAFTSPFTNNCSSNSCASGETMIWDIGTLSPGQCVTFYFAPRIKTATPDGTVIAWEATTSNNGGPLVTASTTITVASAPALSVAVDQSRDPVAPGGELVYTLRYGNRTASSVTDAELQFAFPLNTSIVSATSGAVLNEVIRWPLGTIPAGAVGQEEVVVAVPDALAAGTLVEGGAVIVAVSNALTVRGRAFAAACVAPGSPLGLSLNVSAQPVRPGQLLEIEVTVTNTSSSQLAGVQVDMPFPDHMVNVFESLISGPFTNNCSSNACVTGEYMAWNVGTMNPGQSLTFSVPSAVEATATDGSVIRWEAVASADGGARATRSETITVDSDPALTIAIDERDDPVVAGGELTYTIRYGNRSASSVMETEMRFRIPGNVALVSATGGGELVDGEVSWSLGTLPAGGVHQQEVIVSAGGDLLAGALIESEAVIGGISNFLPTERRATSVATVATGAPLRLSLTVGPQPARPGQQLEVAMTVTNPTESPRSGVRVEMRYPAGMAGVFESFFGAPFTNNCSSNACAAGENMIWDVGTLNPGQAATFSLPPVIPAQTVDGSAILWRATASDDSGARVSESTTITIDSDPAFSIAVDESRDPVPAGGEMLYTVRYGNRSPSSATDVELRFRIPQNATFVSASGDAVMADGEVSWALGSLPAGASAQQRVAVTVDDDLASGSLVEADALIEGTRNSLPTERRAVAAAYVAPTVPLALSLNVGPQPARPGDPLDVEVTLANTASSQLFGVQVAMRYPSGVNSVFEVFFDEPFTNNCTSNACTTGENMIWDVGTMNPGQSVVFAVPPVVSTDVPGGSGISWEAIATDDGGAVVRESRTVSVDSGPALSIAIDESVDPVPAGGELIYTVHYGNSSASSVADVDLELRIPEGVTFARASGGGSFADGRVAWSVGTLPAGAVAREQVVVRVDDDLAPGALIESEAAMSGTTSSLSTERRATSVAYVAPGTPLALSLNVTPSLVQPREMLDVSMTASNTSDSQVFGARVLMRYPAGMNSIFESAFTPPFTNNCTSNACAVGEVMIWDLGPLVPGASVSFSFPPVVSTATTLGTIIQWKARATEDSGSLRHASFAGERLDQGETVAFTRGDCNGDGQINIVDGIFDLNFQFGNGAQSNCVEACDTNDDGTRNIVDPIALFNFLFGDGAPPREPFPDCGEVPVSETSPGCQRLVCE